MSKQHALGESPASSPLQPTQNRPVAIPVALLLPIVLALVTGVLVGTSHFPMPKPAFYGAAAQVIPVLVVAFAVESRAVKLLAQPEAKFYRGQLFFFLLGGELFALLGVSGALRGGVSSHAFAAGQVASTITLTNLIAGGTAAGLVGGFVMVAVVALGGPGWLLVTRAGQPPAPPAVHTTPQNGHTAPPADPTSPISSYLRQLRPKNGRGWRGRGSR